MNNILYLKVFSGLPGIQYKESATHISFGHTMLGIGVLVVLIYLIFRSPSENRYLSVIICVGLLIVGFAIFAVRARRLQPDIAAAVTQNQTTVQTKYAYDGGNLWFPLSPIAGVVIGLIVYNFFKGLSWHNNLLISILALGVGAVLAIGLTYMYWEYKYDKTIMVYNYSRLPK